MVVAVVSAVDRHGGCRRGCFADQRLIGVADNALEVSRLSRAMNLMRATGDLCRHDALLQRGRTVSRKARARRRREAADQRIAAVDAVAPPMALSAEQRRVLMWFGRQRTVPSSAQVGLLSYRRRNLARAACLQSPCVDAAVVAYSSAELSGTRSADALDD
jgi:hypothetical protein